MMYQYETFESNEEFVEWQKQYEPGVVINSVTPMVFNMTSDQKLDATSITNTVGVVVVYSQLENI